MDETSPDILPSPEQIGEQITEELALLWESGTTKPPFSLVDKVEGDIGLNIQEIPAAKWGEMYQIVSKLGRDAANSGLVTQLLEDPELKTAIDIIAGLYEVVYLTDASAREFLQQKGRPIDTLRLGEIDFVQGLQTYVTKKPRD
jgi:hypothetical protein